MKRVLALLLCVILLSAAVPASAAQLYPDVPQSHWAAADIAKVREYGLMEGYETGLFGPDDDLTRAAFSTMLCRMFSWPAADLSAEGFPYTYIDCTGKDWFTPYVEAAYANGVLDRTVSFRPNDPISRGEMAVMLVRALGYEQLAQAGYAFDLPFHDVPDELAPYIALAWQFGMTNGVEHNGELCFMPNSSATRKEVAAMISRVYSRYQSGIQWLHGFYAFSSYSQIDLTADLDCVSVGWARLQADHDGIPFVNTTSSGGNEWVIPKQPSLATDFFRQNGTACNLDIFADDPTLISSAASRTAAINSVIALAEDFSGVTVDFEQLRAEDRENFTAFMTELRQALPKNKPLFVCVSPVVPDDSYFDGYDYRALGELCDKVILMAHDYHYTTVPVSYLGTARTNSPLTPFDKIYYSLAALTHPDSGVADRSKLALAISFNSVGWQVNENNQLTSTSCVQPIPSTIFTRLQQADTTQGWSESARNPYIYYTTQDAARYRLWYENERSVMDKINLAQMFGITGISLWRLGTIPNYPSEALSYDVWGAIQAER